MARKTLFCLLLLKLLFIDVLSHADYDNSYVGFKMVDKMDWSKKGAWEKRREVDGHRHDGHRHFFCVFTQKTVGPPHDGDRHDSHRQDGGRVYTKVGAPTVMTVTVNFKVQTRLNF
jgi:hypothetical protein